MPLHVVLTLTVAVLMIAKASPRSEVYVARALIIVDLTTAALSAVCLGITIGTRAFHRIPTPHT